MRYKFLAIVALVMARNSASQEAKPLYQSGHFPVGPIYTEQTVSGLIDKPVPDPAYMIGTFLYLEKYQDEYMFTSFAHGLTNAQVISFGDVLIGVKFFNNAPELSSGKAIVTDANNPLTIRSVKRSSDGKKTIILAESWSEK